MDTQKKAKIIKAIQAYAKEKSCLIAEESSSGRTLFKRILASFGFNNSNIHMAQDYLQTNEILKKIVPDFFILSFEFGEDKLLSFLNLHLEKKTSRLNSSFIVTSGNNSKSFSSMMLQLEVDVFFSKPFTVQLIEEGMFNLLRIKAEPSKSLKALEYGRELYFKKDFANGIDHFNKYSDLANYSSLAEYYKGKMLWATDNLIAAEVAFKRGVDLKPDHFKCLTTLCDLYVNQKRYPEAHEYFELLLKNFPVNPSQICGLIRASIYNKKFNDIIDLIDTFNELKEVDELTKLNIAAGLAISSRYLVLSEKKEKAIQVLNMAADFCLGKKEIVKEIVTQLLQIKEIEEAGKIFDRFSKENGDSKEFKLLSLEINSHVCEPDRVFKQVSDLLRDGIKEPLVYLVALDASIKMGRNSDSIKELVFSAKKNNPYHSELFEKYLTLNITP